MTAIDRETGMRPSWAAEAFGDPAATDVAQSIARIGADPSIPHKPGARIPELLTW